jgi:hypothetical protein
VRSLEKVTVSHRPPISHPAQGIDPERIAAWPPFRFLGQLDHGDQVARRRIPPGELGAGHLADRVAASVAPDEILRPQRLAVEQLDIDPRVVPREAGHLAAAVDRNARLVDPAGEHALAVVLPQPEPVVVPGGERR